MPDLDYKNLQDQAVRVNFQLLQNEIASLKTQLESLTSRVNELESI